MRRLLISALVLAATCRVDAQAVVWAHGATLPATCTPVGIFVKTADPAGVYVCAASNTWSALSTSTSALAAGTITLILSGTCPTGFEEATELAGKALVGTLAANKDVGTTGGSDTITPAGTNSAPAFTGTPSTTVVNHTHLQNTSVVTTGNFTAVTTAVDTSAGGTGGSPTLTALSVATGNPVSGGAASYTPAGTVAAPVFTGTQFDNRSAFVRVIFCRKT